MFVYHSPFLRIQRVEVRISPQTPPFISLLYSDLIRELYSLRGENYFKARKKIKKLQEIWAPREHWENFSLKTFYPSEVKLEAEVKIPRYALEVISGDNVNVYLYDSSFNLVGAIPKPIPNLSKTLFSLRVVLEKRPEDEDVKLFRDFLFELVSLKGKLESEEDLEISSFSWLSTQGALVTNITLAQDNFTRRLKLVLGSPLDLNRKFEILTDFLKLASSYSMKRDLLPSLREGYLLVTPNYVIVVRYP